MKRAVLCPPRFSGAGASAQAGWVSPPGGFPLERGRLGKGGSKGGKPRRGKQHETTPPAALLKRPAGAAEVAHSLRRATPHRGVGVTGAGELLRAASTGHDNAGDWREQGRDS